MQQIDNRQSTIDTIDTIVLLQYYTPSDLRHMRRLQKGKQTKWVNVE